MKRPSLLCNLALAICLCAGHHVAQALHDSTSVRAQINNHATAQSDIEFPGLHVDVAVEEASDVIEEPSQILPDTVINKRMHAHALLEQVLSGQRFLESLDALSEIDLPIGVAKSGGDLDYTVLIDRIRITKEGAVIDVYLSLALPQTEARLAFYGAVPLSARGGIAGNARVYLLGDHPIKLSPSTLITIKGDERTYVEFDCTGFIAVNLDAELQFSTDLIVPEDANGNAGNERVRLSFTTYTQSLHDVLVQVTVPPFQIKGLKGFGFHVTKAYLDWSDLSNPPGISFPAGYSSSVIDAGLPNLWQGIFLQEAEVRLPPAFARRDNENRIAVGAQELILDDNGITGQLYVTNVLPDGDMNGWQYSIDQLSLELIANAVMGLTLDGTLSMPVVKGKNSEQTRFAYTAHRAARGDYIFAVEIEDELKLDLWAADVKLSNGSVVTVTEKNNKFYPSAHLNGELTINLIGKGPKAAFNSIRFENMVINSEAPYFVPGTFGFGREGQHSSIARYPVVFDNISVKSEDDRVGLGFDLMVNISGKPQDESFAGKGSLIVWGKQDNQPGRDADGKVIRLDRYSWKFDVVALTSIRINVKKPKVIELAGEVRFYDEDPIYGDGFKGSLKGKIQTITVQAQALFGRTESFRYWYADALVELDNGIPVVPGVLSAFGFGGGYYHRMAQSQGPVGNTLGKSPSGITYVPEENTAGIRAIVLIGTPRPEAMKGDVALEVSLNRHGGINSVTFTGNANFMSAASLGGEQIKQLAAAAVSGKLTEKLGSLTRGQVYGSVRLHFDNVNDVFHGNLEIYVNVAGGIVRGVGDGNKAGWAELHFEKNNWYVHIGTPDQPLGLEVARIFKAKSYFMLGRNLPGSPPPPPQVSEILGDIDLDYMRDMNALESGMGIAFGLHFLVDTGDLRFLMFYGRFSAGTGLDFMLKDYGNEYHCAGSSGPMGINGWYANGQAYAFVMGKIGVKVNLRFYKGTYDILSIGAAAILQAKGPNPFWMKGTVGGYYKILGGLVKGRCRFEVTVGRECKPVADQNLLEEVNMIAAITPANGSSDVNVFNTPQIAFNIPVGEIFEIKDLEGKTHSFRAVLDEFTVRDGVKRIEGQLNWNAEKDVVVFDAFDLLPGQKKLHVQAKLTFEEKINGDWQKVRFSGKIVAENAETKFETGKAPDFIPESNIVYAYPVPNQLNFFPGEYSVGFLRLKEGQPYLFNPGKEWMQTVRMVNASTRAYVETSFTYDVRKREVTFRLPSDLVPATVYEFQIVNVPRQTTHVDQNVETVSREIKIDESAGTATMTTQQVEGSLDMLEAKPIYQSHFRTSRHKTFAEKMASVSLSPVIRLSPEINIFQLTAYLRGEEGFDDTELPRAAASQTFLRAEAILENNSWYDNHVHPLVYDGYPLFGWMRVNRPQPDVLGIPPVRDIYFRNVKRNIPSGFVDGATMIAPAFTDEFIVYNVGRSVAADFRDVQRHAVNFVVDHPEAITPRLELLVTRPLPSIRYGPYRLRLSYVIPGIERQTSSYEIELFNRIPDND